MRRAILLILIFAILSTIGCSKVATETTKKNTDSGASKNETPSPQSSPSDNKNSSLVMSDLVAYGISIGDMMYYPISFEERKVYGLINTNAMGLSSDNTYKITENNLGNYIGSVDKCGDKKLIGASIYHYLAYNNDNSICIVESDGKYAFYVFAYYETALQEGLSTNEILTIYGVTINSITQIKVIDSNDNLVDIVTDVDRITDILSLLSGKDDIGNGPHEKLFANLWYKTYGNKDVSYDGEHIYYSSDSVYEKAHQIWNSDQRQLSVNLKDGISVGFLYNPAIKSVCTHSCFYALTDEEVAVMNTMLSIN